MPSHAGLQALDTNATTSTVDVHHLSSAASLSSLSVRVHSWHHRIHHPHLRTTHHLHPIYTASEQKDTNLFLRSVG